MFIHTQKRLPAEKRNQDKAKRSETKRTMVCSECGNLGHLRQSCLRCQKCGRWGHQTSDCRMCQNCGTKVHAPFPQCTACQKCGRFVEPAHALGHCTTPWCTTCGVFGHLRDDDDCRPSEYSGYGPYPGDNHDDHDDDHDDYTCSCGTFGHAKEECQKCRNCGTHGHGGNRRERCTYCSRCRHFGHLPEDCSWSWDTRSFS